MSEGIVKDVIYNVIIHGVVNIKKRENQNVMNIKKQRPACILLSPKVCI